MGSATVVKDFETIRTTLPRLLVHIKIVGRLRMWMGEIQMERKLERPAHMCTR